MLDRYQRDIATALAEAEDALVAPDTQAREQLAKVRWQLLRLLRSYQLFKHTELFDPLGRHHDPQRAARAQSMKARCTEIGQSFTDHVTRWSPTAIGAGFAEYRREARDMVARLDRHLRREAAEAALLLAGIERTRRP